MRKSSVLLLAFLLFSELSAAGVRTVLLQKIILDGKKVDNMPLKSMGFNVLKQQGIRIVDVEQSRLAKSEALFKLIKKGEISDGFKHVNADVIVSHELLCSPSKKSILDTGIGSHYCGFHTNVIRTDTGDAIFSHSKDLIAYGASKHFAIKYLLKHHVRKIILDNSDKWIKKVTAQDTWNLDLFVSGFDNPVTARKLNKLIDEFPEAISSSVVSFSPELTEITIEGKGKENLKKFKQKLAQNSALGFKINYDKGNIVYSEIDLEKANIKTVDVFLSFDKEHSYSDVVSKNGSNLLKSYMQNLGFFNIKSVTVEQPLIEMEMDTRFESNKSDASEKKSVPVKENITDFILKNDLIMEKGVWFNTITFIDTRTDETVLASVGKGSDPYEAMYRATDNFNSHYKIQLSKDSFRKKLNIEKSTSTYNSRLIQIPEFKVGNIFPSLHTYYKREGIGSLTIKNNTISVMSDFEVIFKIDNKVTYTQKFDILLPGATNQITIKPHIVPDTTNVHAQIKAEIVYKDVGIYRKEEAYAPLIVHSENAIDLSDPSRISSFITTDNKKLTNLVTTAINQNRVILKREIISLPNLLNKETQGVQLLLTDELSTAALIYESLWHSKLKYVEDPKNSSLGSNIDSIQYPGETLERLAGDCDDLTVLLASMYESVGIATAIIIVPGHTFVAVDSGAIKGGSRLFNLPESAFIEINGALFVPIETTMPGRSFSKAWARGIENLKASKGNTKVFRTREVWKKYPSFLSKSNPINLTPVKPDIGKLTQSLKEIKKRIKDIKPKNSKIASALMNWFSGKKKKAIKESANLCNEKISEACYNLALMTKNSPGVAHVELVGALDDDVLSMMLDSEGSGLGKEVLVDINHWKNYNRTLKKAIDSKVAVNNSAKECKKLLKEISVSDELKKSIVKNNISPFKFFWVSTK